jgi:hypothetical protein
MGAPEVTAFLTSLAVRDKVAASTQNQPLSALLFLYRGVFGVDLPWLEDVVRAKRPQYLPVVMTRDETRAVLQQLNGVARIMALLLYGAGLRLLECCRLRVKDVDFAANQIVIRDGRVAKIESRCYPRRPEPCSSDTSTRCEPNTKPTFAAEPAGSSYPAPSCGSTRMPDANGRGSGSSPPRDSMWIVQADSAAATIFTSPCSSVP